MTTVDLQGEAERIVEVPGSPSGLGWLPDGRLLVVSMTDRRLLRLDPDGLSEAADLGRLASFHCNDMVVDQQGLAFIGNFGFDFAVGAPVSPAEIVLVTPDGRGPGGERWACSFRTAPSSRRTAEPSSWPRPSAIA